MSFAQSNFFLIPTVGSVEGDLRLRCYRNKKWETTELWQHTKDFTELPQSFCQSSSGAYLEFTPLQNKNLF